MKNNIAVITQFKKHFDYFMVHHVSEEERTNNNYVYIRSVRDTRARTFSRAIMYAYGYELPEYDEIVTIILNHSPVKEIEKIYG